jgi:hypothetical protein
LHALPVSDIALGASNRESRHISQQLYGTGLILHPISAGRQRQSMLPANCNFGKIFFSVCPTQQNAKIFLKKLWKSGFYLRRIQT